MRTRTRINKVEIKSNTRGRDGGNSGGTTCTREVTLDEVINNFWKGNFPEEDSITVDEVITFTDTLTPNYTSRRKKGELLPTNPMTKVTQRVLPPGTPVLSVAAHCFHRTLQCTNPKTRNYIAFRQGSVAITVNPIGGTFSDLITGSEIQDIQREALAKLRSQGIDYLTSMVELRQTIAMLAGARKRLVDIVEKMVRHVRRLGKRPRSFSDLLDEVGGAWLEGRFGWRILYYDLLAITQYIENVQNDKKLVVGRNSRTKTRYVTSHYGDRTETDEVKIGYPGILSYDVPGSSSIPNTVWEVIPFSLVVDMFFNVQTWVIASSGSVANVNEYPAGAFMTRTKTTEGNVQAQRALPPEGYSAVYLNKPAVVSQFYEVKTRSHIGMPPIGLPSFRFNLGGYKPIDLLFLTRILIGKL